MTELNNLVGFVLLIAILIGIFNILNEKSEVQLIMAIISILIGGISYQIFGVNNFSNSLMIGGLIIGAIGFKKIIRQIRF